MQNYIMVLNDEETYTTLAGCVIIEIDDRMSPEEIEEEIKRTPPVVIFDVLNGIPHLEISGTIATERGR